MALDVGTMQRYEEFGKRQKKFEQNFRNKVLFEFNWFSRSAVRPHVATPAVGHDDEEAEEGEHEGDVDGGMAKDYVRRETDHVVCLVDMDRLLSVPAEMATYQQLKRKSSRNVVWVETSPCTEFWFLLHFLPQLSTKHYATCEDVLPDLQRYMPGYEKTARYFRKNNLYTYLTEHGDLHRAIGYAKELSRLAEATPQDKMAYNEMSRVCSRLLGLRRLSVSRDSWRVCDYVILYATGHKKALLCS